jgi:hypothetical protein
MGLRLLSKVNAKLSECVDIKYLRPWNEIPGPGSVNAAQLLKSGNVPLHGLGRDELNYTRPIIRVRPRRNEGNFCDIETSA